MEDLEGSSDFARAVLDVLPEHICVIDNDGVILAVNAAWRQFSIPNQLLSHDACVGMNYLEACDKASGEFADEAAIAATGIRQVLRGERPTFSFSYSCDSPDEIRWFLMTATAVKRPYGIHALIAHEDISERKQAERALNLLAQRFQQVVDTTHDGIWTFRLPERKAYYNDRIFTMLGHLPLNPDDAGPFIWSIVHPEDKPAATRKFEDFMRGLHETISIECRVRAHDNSWRWIWSRARVVEWNAAGKPSLLAGSHTDITERKELERQVRQSQKLEAIGTLAGGIAHDFNNILAGIAGYAQLAEQELEPGTTTHRDVERVRQGADRAKELIRQIVTFSRAREQERHPLRLQFIVKEALKMMRSVVPANIALEENVDVDCRPVLSDATQMHQIVMNLCTNAYQAMGEKGGTLFVELVEVINPLGATGVVGPHVRLRVSDTGCGISEDINERVFDPFFTTREPGSGTGLGLSMIHGIVTAHGGDVRFVSKPGQGTTFEVLLPCVVESISQEEDERGPLAQGSGEHILFVDNEEALRTLMTRRLTGLHYFVHEFSSGPAAVEYMKGVGNRVDLVLTDQQMVNMTGVELAAAVKAFRPDLPIVIMTGNSTMVDEHNYADFGFAAYLQKPISIHKLAATLHDEITRAQSAAGAA